MNTSRLAHLTDMDLRRQKRIAAIMEDLTMTQMDLLSGAHLKDEGCAIIAAHYPDFHSWAVARIQDLARRNSRVTADDLRQVMEKEKIVAPHPNSLGAAFRSAGLICVGFEPSTHPANHARPVRVWRLKK